jgi:thioredoxin-dependent peroxiredoxin
MISPRSSCAKGPVILSPRSRPGLACGLGTAFLVLALALAAPARPAAADPAPTEPVLLEVGGTAPDFTVTAHTGEKVQLSKLRGRYVVLYFYPKDDTPGCTKQACDFRDNWTRLEKAGVKVFGVSTQGNESHKAFAGKYKLPFPLLPDEDGALARKYGVPLVNGVARRITYLVDKNGKVKHVWPKVNPVGHAGEILAQIEAK